VTSSEAGGKKNTEITDSSTKNACIRRYFVIFDKNIGKNVVFDHKSPEFHEKGEK